MTEPSIDTVTDEVLIRLYPRGDDPDNAIVVNGAVLKNASQIIIQYDRQKRSRVVIVLEGVEVDVRGQVFSDHLSRSKGAHREAGNS